MQSAYDDFPASSYAAYRCDAICNDVFRTNGRLSDNGRAGIVAHSGSRADCRAPYYVAQFEIRRNKKSGTFR